METWEAGGMGWQQAGVGGNVQAGREGQALCQGAMALRRALAAAAARQDLPGGTVGPAPAVRAGGRHMAPGLVAQGAGALVGAAVGRRVWGRPVWGRSVLIGRAERGGRKRR
jgi:hypothetical protein